MEKSEFIEAVQKIGTCEDEIERRTLLTGLQDDISAIFDSNSDLTEKNTNLQAENEKLVKANMELFLRIGNPKDQSEIKQNETGIENKEEETMKFEDLFNEKGELK